jgi:hypothetical protein
MQHEHKTSAPETRLWRYMVWPPEPGHFFDNLEMCRKKMLESGRSPKVALYGGSKVVSLKYQCTKAKDGQTGVCVVKEAIPDAKKLEEWLQRLPRQVDWHAERLPALTHKALNELLKAEHLRNQTGAQCAAGSLTTTSSGTTRILCSRRSKGNRQLGKPFVPPAMWRRQTWKGSRTELWNRLSLFQSGRISWRLRGLLQQSPGCTSGRRARRRSSWM